VFDYKGKNRVNVSEIVCMLWDLCRSDCICEAKCDWICEKDWF